MSKALIPIDIIASGICSGMGDSTNRKKYRITQHLLSGYKELHLFIGQDISIKTAILSYDNTINLPCDFVYVTKVGALYNGNLAVLSLDKSVRKQSLTQSQSQEQLDAIFNGVFSGQGSTFYNCFRGGNYLGEMYGHGRGVLTSGYYSIEKTDGVINIGSQLPIGAEVVIEYKSDGISSGLKLVPTEMENVITNWAKWKYNEDIKDKYWAEYYEIRYEKTYNKLQRFYNTETALYMAATINESFSPTNY